jgi:hypothetical protein
MATSYSVIEFSKSPARNTAFADEKFEFIERVCGTGFMANRKLFEWIHGLAKGNASLGFLGCDVGEVQACTK